MASYLSNTSCVSFAISLFDAPTSQEPSAFSKAIINASNENWESIDFKDIQDIFDRNLTDDDIRWVLLAIDGVNKIKSLKFTNCIGITGSGLQPLTGSTVLERIDLSLVGDYENPTIDPEPPISAELVVPILNSIISTENNSLVHVQLPKKWRIERSNLLTRFLQRFDRQLNSRRYSCSGCEDGEVCQRYENEYELVYWGQGVHNDTGWLQLQYGTVSLSCYQCEKNFCFGCEQHCHFSFCRTCDKYYCNYVNHCQGNNCTKPYQTVVLQGLQCCEELYCEANHCVDCSDCTNVCQGDGCDRANCNGYNMTGNYSSNIDCSTKNIELPGCVMVREHKDDEEEDDENRTFCGECWEKNREGIEEGDD